MKNLDEALTDLFHTYGARLTSDRLTQYAVVLRDRAPCPACLSKAMDDARSAFDKMPTPKAILALYWSAHGEHRPERLTEEPGAYVGPIGREHAPADDVGAA